MEPSRLLPVVISLFLFSNTAAQNLVPNAGFESVAVCPNATGQLFLASPWDSLNASPDLFNSCSNSSPVCQSVNVPTGYMGNAPAHSGNGYAGFTAKSSSANYREYIQSPLIAPLNAGKIYKVEAWFRRAPSCNAAVSNIGITLSSGALTQFGTSPLGFPPQVESSSVISNSNEWTRVRGFIVAFGGENNIAIGNFRDDAATASVPQSNAGAACALAGAYYFTDDVRVEPVNESVSISGDNIICQGMSTTLYANTNTTAWWSVQSDPSLPVSNASSITVSPSSTTTYILNGIFLKDSITVQVLQPPVVNLGNDTTICDGNYVTLNALNPNSTYLWSTGENTSFIEIYNSGNYWVKVDNGGCTVSDTMKLNVLKHPEIIPATDSVFCSLTNDFILLDAGGGTTYWWSPTNETTQTIIPKSEGFYLVTVTHADGCTKSGSVQVKEICEPLVFVPNAFTPNGDGKNDLLSFSNSGIEIIDIKIFSRWGSIVYYSDELDASWDGMINGKDAPSGTYVYLISFKSPAADGTMNEATAKGYFILIR